MPDNHTISIDERDKSQSHEIDDDNSSHILLPSKLFRPVNWYITVYNNCTCISQVAITFVSLRSRRGMDRKVVIAFSVTICVTALLAFIGALHYLLNKKRHEYYSHRYHTI